MKRLQLLSSIGLLTVLLASCNTGVAPEDRPAEEVRSSSSISSPSMASSTVVEGMLEKAGIGIYMEGTHRLQMDDGTFLLLRSSDVRLDDYVDSRVSVTGQLQPTVEQGAMIMTVSAISRIEPSAMPEVLMESNEAGSSSPAAVADVEEPSSSSSSNSSIRPLVNPPRTPPASSSSSDVSTTVLVGIDESESSSSSAASSQAAQPTSLKAIAKESVDTGHFTTKYCSSYIGFCLPLHKNWYYQSFAANVAPYLWHVEVGNTAIEEAGQGVIIVNLVSGPLEGPEGVAVEQGDFVVASRQWTGNRHFEVTGPKDVRTAVEYMANGLEVYEAPSAQ